MKQKFYAFLLKAVKCSCHPVRLLMFFTVALPHQTVAQNFRLLKDINTAKDGNPNNFGSNTYNYNIGFSQYLNGVSYFAADDGINGIGLWRTDGTPGGTFQVKAGIGPSNIIVANGQLFFAGSGNPGLWKSDGTEAGTVPVLNIVPPGLGAFSPQGLTNLNGTIFFTISSNTSQLWKTDGTANGTVLVKDLFTITNNGVEGVNIFGITAIKNKIYFSASGANYAYVPWVSNGTLAGTFKIANNVVDPGQFTARSADVTDSIVYFTASSQQFGTRSLYVTNGQQGAAGIAAGFNGITSGNYFTQELINIGGVIYFIGRANSNTQNESLYKFDINAANGVQPLKIITGTGLNNFASYVSGVYYQNSNLFFTVYDAINNKSQLWKSNGTSLGNVLIKDSLGVYGFFNVNGISYFTGSNSTNGSELWKTDGTVNGTVLIKDIIPGYKSSQPNIFAASGNTVVFAATSLETGRELWKSDGTSAGTALLKDINQTSTSSSNPNGLIAFKDKLLFSAFNIEASSRDLLFSSDGTETGTSIVTDTVYGGANFGFKDNEFYFWGYSKTEVQGIYKSNGTAAGTKLVKDFTGIPTGTKFFISTDSLVYFAVYNGATAAQELWRSDGTDANTYVIKNDFPYLDNRNFKTVGNALYFSVPNGGLWKTDGTINGTVLIKSFTNNVDNLVAGNGVLFFKYYDGVNNNIWKSDGTATGTVKITDNVTNAVPLIFSGNDLFFTGTGNNAIYGNLGNELYRTDGTASGTFLVKDIIPGNGSSSVQQPIVVNGMLYFVNYGNSGVELWRSNGTDTGTALIYSLGNNGPAGLVSCNGKIFFQINDYTNKTFLLWESDGTSAGTHPVTDNLLANLKFDYGANLTAVGNQLFLTARNQALGQELYVGDISGPPANDSFSLCPNGSAGITSNLVGTNYQWQFKADTALAFSNLAESGIFSGVATSTLLVKNIPSSYAGAKFRCQVNGNTYSKTTTLTFAVNWTGNIDNNWNNTGNWGCGGLLPDANTNVVINYGQVIVNTNATCRNIYVKPGASVVVNTGFTLTITGR